MTGSLIAMMCAQGIYTAACNNAVQAGMIQSGVDSFVSQKTREVSKLGMGVIGKEVTTMLGMGMAAYRFSNGRELSKHLRSPISDGMVLRASPTQGSIELRWGF